jgi:hypothetical protein
MEPSKSFFKKNIRVIRFLFSLSPAYVLVYILYFLLQAFFPLYSDLRKRPDHRWDHRQQKPERDHGHRLCHDRHELGRWLDHGIPQ